MGIKIGSNNEIKDSTIIDGDRNSVHDDKKPSLFNKLIIPVAIVSIGGIIVAIFTSIIN